MLSGRCKNCGNLLWGTEKGIRKHKKEPSIVHKWFYDLLHSNLPHFSPKLRKSLLLDAYVRNGGSLSDSNDQIAKELWQIYNKMVPYDQVVNKTIKISIIYDLLHGYHDSYPAIVFWLPIINAYTCFDSFHKYLSEISRKFEFDYSHKFLKNEHSELGVCEGLCLKEEDPLELTRIYSDIYYSSVDQYLQERAQN